MFELIYNFFRDKIFFYIFIIETPKTKMFSINSVLISDNVDVRCANKLISNGISVKVDTKMTKEQLLEEIKVSFFS